MGRKQQKIIWNEKAGIVQGNFRLGDEDPGRPGKRLKICDIEEALYKETSRGRSKRSSTETKRFVNILYQEKLEYLLAKKVEEEQRKKSPHIGELLQEWLETRIGNRAPRTIKESRYLIENYIAVNDDHPVVDISEQHINHFKDYIRARGCRDTTLNKRLRELQTFLNWVYEKELLPRPFKIEKIRETRQKPRILSHEQEEQLVKRILGLLSGTKSKRRWFGYYNHFRAYMMLAHTGLRRAELLHLKIEDIDLKNGVLLIKDDVEAGGSHKVKERKEKKVPISNDLLAFLEKDLKDRGEDEIYYLDDGYGAIYFKYEDSLTHAFRKHLRELGIKDVKPVHGFRATVASRLINLYAVDISHVKEILGHSDISTTLLYKDPDMVPLKKAVSNLSNGKSKIRIPSINNKMKEK